jgi:hypothetical protein
MRTTGKRRAIRQAFYRLGLHTTPAVVVHALMQQGIHVDEQLVRQVRFQLVKEATDARVGQVAKPVLPQRGRRWAQGFPRRGQR